MSSPFHRLRLAFIAVVLLSLGNLSVLQGAVSRTNSPAARATEAAADAVPAEPEIPKSVFRVPVTSKDGKDPFFPRSTRMSVTVPLPVKTNQVPTPVVDLKINGMSGSDDRPLVIINNETFGVGDTRDVISGGQKISIKCLEIDRAAGRATVQVGRDRRDLYFKDLGK